MVSEVALLEPLILQLSTCLVEAKSHETFTRETMEENHSYRHSVHDYF
jgi:hypothetical protein